MTHSIYKSASKNAHAKSPREKMESARIVFRDADAKERGGVERAQRGVGEVRADAVVEGCHG